MSWFRYPFLGGFVLKVRFYAYLDLGYSVIFRDETKGGFYNWPKMGYESTTSGKPMRYESEIHFIFRGKPRGIKPSGGIKAFSLPVFYWEITQNGGSFGLFSLKIKFDL